MTYTLDVIQRVSEQLQRNVDDTVAEWRRLASEGDEDAAALIQAWESQPEPR